MINLSGRNAEDRQATTRLPFQILVLPFRRSASGTIEYAVFRRNEENYWQGIAGGGEQGEAPAEAARRECREEVGVPGSAKLYSLKTVASIPAYHFADHSAWGDDVYVVPEYSFAVDVARGEIKISAEHSEFRWVDFENAKYLLYWESNKTALWELNERLLKQDLVPA